MSSGLRPGPRRATAARRSRPPRPAPPGCPTRSVSGRPRRPCRGPSPRRARGRGRPRPRTASSPMRRPTWIGYTDVDSSGRGARDGRAVYEGPQAPEAFHRRVQEADSRPLQRRKAQARDLRVSSMSSTATLLKMAHGTSTSNTLKSQIGSAILSTCLSCSKDTLRRTKRGD